MRLIQPGRCLPAISAIDGIFFSAFSGKWPRMRQKSAAFPKLKFYITRHGLSTAGEEFYYWYKKPLPPGFSMCNQPMRHSAFLRNQEEYTGFFRKNLL